MCTQFCAILSTNIKFYTWRVWVCTHHFKQNKTQVQNLNIYSYATWVCTHHFGQPKTLPQGILNSLIKLHESNISAIPEKQNQSLIQLDLVVQEKSDQDDQGDRVEEDVANQRPGCQAENQETISHWRHISFYLILRTLNCLEKESLVHTVRLKFETL